MLCVHPTTADWIYRSIKTFSYANHPGLSSISASRICSIVKTFFLMCGCRDSKLLDLAWRPKSCIRCRSSLILECGSSFDRSVSERDDSSCQQSLSVQEANVSRDFRAVNVYQRILRGKQKPCWGKSPIISSRQSPVSSNSRFWNGIKVGGWVQAFQT